MRVARWTRIFSVWAWVALAAWAAARAGVAADPRSEAIRLYNEGKYSAALPLLDEVLSRRHRDIELLMKRGTVSLRQNQAERALADFDAGARYSPTFAPAFTNRGIALVMLGRDDEALASFRRAIALSSFTVDGFAVNRSTVGLADDYCGIGQVYHRKGDHDQALAAYNKAIEYNPKDPNGYVGRGEALAGMRRYDEAVADYTAALRLDPRHSRALGYRAVALDQLGRDDEALADYDASVRLDPGVAMMRRYRGALLSRRGQHEQAVLDLAKAIELDPKDAGAYKDRGGVYNRMGAYAQALQDLDKALRLDPRSAKAYQNRAATYNGLARYDLALRDCDEALRLDPKNSGAWSNRGLALLGLGRSEGAVADLTEALRLHPRQVAAYVNRSVAYAQLGELDLSAADYGEVVRLDPKAAQTFAGLLRGIEPRHGPGGATSRDDQLAQRLSPAVAEAVVSCHRGEARRVSGDWPGAIDHFTRALRLDPKNADAYVLRGYSRLCAGVPGSESDARTWLDLRGWRDPFAPYMALLGVLAARRAGHDQAATAFLDEALAHTHPLSWPAPVFRYLKREIGAPALLAAADTTSRTTEARVVIGLDLLDAGLRSVAWEHLCWARDHGAERTIARDLAREALRRAEAADPPSLVIAR
jgi:tetratricopeptide (TPR) repeat protein